MADSSSDAASTFGSTSGASSRSEAGLDVPSDRMSQHLASQLDDPIPPPTITLAGVGMVVAGWLLYTLLYAVLLTRAENIPFIGALLGQLLECLLLGAASLPVWWLTIRKMDGASGLTLTLTHAAIGPIFAWGTLELYLWLMNAIAGPSITQEISDQYQWVFVSHLTLYIMEFAAFHLVRSIQRLRWRERQAAEYASLARDRELAALKAQINPHFLFNTFNSISATVHVAPEQAREMLADLADLFRYALDRADEDAVPLKDELDFAKSYLDLEAHRFHDRLDIRYDINAPDDALDVRVPPIILQPLVENAIKHGISPSEDGGTICVSVTQASAADLASRPAKQADGPSDDEPSGNGQGRPEEPRSGTLDGDLLRVEVFDTGVGPDDSFAPGPVGSSDHAGSALPPKNGNASSDGVGLTNTNRRLLHAFGPIARLHAEPVSPHGFRVWFHLPRF